MYNQKVQGFWHPPRDPKGNILVESPPDTTKLENLINKMRQDNIGAWLVQETWEEGNHFGVEIGGYHIFQHNCTPRENGRSHLFKGVDIILSPLFYNAWRAAGSAPSKMTATTDKFAGRFISMTVQYDCYDSHGRRIKGKATKFALTSVYHPCNNDDHAQFCDTLNSLLRQIGIDAKTHLIMGADVNVRLGKRECAEHSKIIGPHGIDQSNERGRNLLTLYSTHQLRIENTFFEHEHYATSVGLPPH
jgi:exonuclease III